MRATLSVSAVLGLLWNFVAMGLLGGSLRDGVQPAWLTAGALAGTVAGAFTVWSRERREGDETLLGVLATYYLGMVAYWAAFVVIERARLCWRAGGWTDFDLADHLGLIVLFVLQGTMFYGIVLIPLCFLSRRLVWAVHGRRRA